MINAEFISISLDSTIASIDSKTFKNIPNLNRLQIYSTETTNGYSFKSDLFAYSPQLTELYISDSSVTMINATFFKSLTKLTDLQIQAKLTSIDAKTFSTYLKNTLILLDLSGNQLTQLSPGLFQNMYYLQSLYLASNKLLSLNSMQFKGLLSLKDLTLGSNRLSSLPKNVFAGLTWVTSLDLSNNMLTTISGDAFKGLSGANLIDLDVSSNHLSSVNVTAFSFSSLCTIHLEFNLISSLAQSFGSVINRCATYTVNLQQNPIISNLMSKNVNIQTLCGQSKRCLISG
jgi:Leucine-rich repeat (LRR) protein